MLLRGLPDFLSRLESGQHAALLGSARLRELAQAAITSAGRREKRRRRLTALLTLYLVIGLCLLRQESAPRVLATLLRTLRNVIDGLPLRPASESAICEARYRLGLEPLERLFSMLTAPPPATFHGFRVWAIDGVRLLVPDSAENAIHFGRAAVGRGRTAYPSARVLARYDVYARRFAAVDIDKHDAAEVAGLEEVMKGQGDGDLHILDRGFPSGYLFWRHIEQRVACVCRISAAWKPRVIRTIGDGDYLVRIEASVPGGKMRQGKQLHRTVHLVLRMIVYTCGGKPIRLLTTLLLPHQYPAIDIAKLYHERWESEVANKELKIHLAAPPKGSPPHCIRSRRPIGVLQEIYALLIAYNLVRDIILEVASSSNLSPLDISFTDTLHAIRLALPDILAASSDHASDMMRRLYNDIAAHCRLRRRRRPRRYPRKVKIKMSDFQAKRATDRQERVDLIAQTTLVSPAPGLPQGR